MTCLTSSDIHMIILLPFNCFFATDFYESTMTLEIRPARILLTIDFAVGYCEFVVNGLTLSS